MKNHFFSFILLLSSCGPNPLGGSSLKLKGKLNSGVVAMWKFDETSIGSLQNNRDFLDYSGNGQFAQAYSGATVGANGKINAGVYFNGTTSYALVDRSPSLNVGNNLTVSAWVYPTLLTSRRAIFSTRFSNAAGSFALELGQGNFGSNVVAVTTPGVWNAQTVNNAVTLNQWQHIVYTRNGTAAGDQKLYVNGVEVSLSTDSPVTFVDNTDIPEIGRSGGFSNFFSGYIDELSIWNRALSKEEVWMLYSINLVVSH